MYAAAYEGALHLDDILARRTHISIETWDRGVAAATEVAALVAPVLGWGAADVAREIEHYDKRVAAERESQYQPDDLSADAARLGAPDVRMGRTAMTETPETTPTTLRELVGAYLAEQCTVIVDAERALRGGENVVHVTRVGSAGCAARCGSSGSCSTSRRPGTWRTSWSGGRACSAPSATWTSCRKA